MDEKVYLTEGDSSVSDNHSSGYHGEVRKIFGTRNAGHQYDTMHFLVKTATGTNHQTARDYLDSAHGRHLADHIHQEDHDMPTEGIINFVKKDFPRFLRRRKDDNVSESVTQEEEIMSESISQKAIRLIKEGRGRPRKNPAPEGEEGATDRPGIYAALLKHRDLGGGEVQFASGEKVRLSPADREKALAKLDQVKAIAQGPKVHDFVKKMDSSHAAFQAAMQEDISPEHSGEQLDEISKKKLGQYVQKAYDNDTEFAGESGATWEQGGPTSKDEQDYFEKGDRRMSNRQKYIPKAIAKLTKESKVSPDTQKMIGNPSLLEAIGQVTSQKRDLKTEQEIKSWNARNPNHKIKK